MLVEGAGCGLLPWWAKRDPDFFIAELDRDFPQPFARSRVPNRRVLVTCRDEMVFEIAQRWGRRPVYKQTL